MWKGNENLIQNDKLNAKTPRLCLIENYTVLSSNKFEYIATPCKINSDGIFEVIEGADSLYCYNAYESINSNSGVQGNGYNITASDVVCSVAPAPSGSPVMVYNFMDETGDVINFFYFNNLVACDCDTGGSGAVRMNEGNDVAWVFGDNNTISKALPPTQDLRTSAIPVFNSVSTEVTGSAPLVVKSVIKVDNLNADMLDGLHSSSFTTSADLTGFVPYTGATQKLELGSNDLGVRIIQALGNVNSGTDITAALGFYLNYAAGTKGISLTQNSAGGNTDPLEIKVSNGGNYNLYAYLKAQYLELIDSISIGASGNFTWNSGDYPGGIKLNRTSANGLTFSYEPALGNVNINGIFNLTNTGYHQTNRLFFDNGSVGLTDVDANTIGVKEIIATALTATFKDFKAANITLTSLNTIGVVTNNASGLLATSPILPIALGGTNSNSQVTNGVCYFNGTSITTSGTLITDGLNFQAYGFGSFAGLYDTTATTPGGIWFSATSGGGRTSNANFVFDNSNVRLGIGRATTTYTLEVNGNIVTWMATGSTPIMRWIQGTTLNGAIYNTANTGDMFIRADNTAASGGNMFFLTGGANERLRITNAGLLGLGTTTTAPSGYLTIKAGTAAIPPIQLIAGTLLSAPINGSFEYDGNRLYFTKSTAIKEVIETALFTQTSSVVVTGDVQTSMFGTGTGTKVLPANTLRVGQTIRVKLEGTHSGTGNPTMQIDAKLGTTTIATGSWTENNVSDEWWKVEFEFTTRSVGASGTIMLQGHYESSEPTIHPFRAATSTSTTTIDTTASQTLDVLVTWSGGTSKSVTVTNASVEIVN